MSQHEDPNEGWFVFIAWFIIISVLAKACN